MNNYFSRPDPTEDRDYSDEIPDRESYRFEFRDGSAIIIHDGEDPEIEESMNTGNSAWKAAKKIDDGEMNFYESINYVKLCE